MSSIGAKRVAEKKSPFPVFKWNFSVADVCRHKGRGGVKVIEEGKGPNLCNP